MFAGHIGVALAAARVEPRLNLGVLAASSLLLDFLLWLFVLVGLESVAIPTNFAATHQPEFIFPYSHGLFTSIIWSALAGSAVVFARRRHESVNAHSAFIVAGVTFSHWLLDALVHRPELPTLGAASRQVGFALWNYMPLALSVESALVFGGLLMFLRGCGLPRSRKLALAALVIVVLAFTLVGMTIAPPPPSATAMAATSLGTIAFTCVLLGWLGKGARARQA